MKVFSSAIALLMCFASVPAGAASVDYFLKIDGVEGESSIVEPRSVSAGETTSVTVVDDPSTQPRIAPEATTTTTEVQRAASDDDATASVSGTVTAPGTGPQEASVDAFLKIDGVEGESTKKGNVEYEWKVEEGESAAEAPETMDVAAEGQAVMPDFSILLGGGSDDDEAETARREVVSEILKQGMEEAGMPAEQVSMNFEKIKTKVTQEVKLFGVIPVRATATVEIDAAGQVKVRFPWWAFLASEKNPDGLGQRVFTTLSNVLKTKHDTVKNAIGNVR